MFAHVQLDAPLVTLTRAESRMPFAEATTYVLHTAFADTEVMVPMAVDRLMQEFVFDHVGVGAVPLETVTVAVSCPNCPMNKSSVFGVTATVVVDGDVVVSFFVVSIGGA